MNANAQKTAVLPSEGLVRLSTVLAILPVSQSSWYRGMKNGTFPKGILIGPATRVFPVEQIRKLLADLKTQKVTPRRQGARKPKAAK